MNECLLLSALCIIVTYLELGLISGSDSRFNLRNFSLSDGLNLTNNCLSTFVGTR